MNTQVTKPRSGQTLTERYDVVVLGSGMGGSTAALCAARAGAQVALVEKLPELGGSAALSAGMFWTAPDEEALRRRIPLGNAQLGAAVVGDFESTLDLIRSTGVRVAEKPTHGIMTYGIGHSFDVRGYLAAAWKEIAERGGSLMPSTRILDLTGDHDGVTGVLARRADGARLTLAASGVVLATGGFQGSQEMLDRYIGPEADRLLHRSNPGSVGDGLRLARRHGGAATGAMGTFYGHLLPRPVSRFTTTEYLPYSQYYSGETLIVNQRGERFVDETVGDELINQDLVHQPGSRAVLIFDERVRREEARKEPFPGTGALDRLEVAITAGGNYATAATVDELVRAIGAWGVDTGQLAATVEAYTTAIERGAASALGVPVGPTAAAPTRAPFHALEVQPSITFTFGGIAIDVQGRVVDEDGEWVPGLYAAGVDVGGISNYGYAGGLAPAAITGRWAGLSAAGDRSGTAATRAMRQ